MLNPSKTTIGSNSINLGFGIQKFRGKGRLQGIYGAEAMFGIGGGSTEFEYLKPLDAASFGSRTKEIKSGSSFMFGVRAFLGAEYFFAPKMSLGAEYGWGISLTSMGASETTVESSNGTAVTTTTTEGGKGSNFNIGVSAPDASLVLSLYF
jgi:hypothetical protein